MTRVESGAAGKMENVFTDQPQGRRRSHVVDVELARLLEERPEAVVLCADMRGSLGTVRRRFPDRFIDLGIAETNTISVAAGLAACGHLPYAVVMAPFGMLKCAEQIRTDLAYTLMPVRIVARLSGLAMGFFGTSHHAVEDIAIARSITNLTAVAASDARSLTALIRSTVDVPGPVYIRVSEGLEDGIYPEVPAVEYGRFLPVRSGSDVTIIATGIGVQAAVGAAEILSREGISAAVLDAVYLKPFDEEAVLRAAETTGAIVTVEEHNVVGGLGAAVAEVLGRHGVRVRLFTHALPDSDLEVGLPAYLWERYGLTPEGVAARVRQLLAG